MTHKPTIQDYPDSKMFNARIAVDGVAVGRPVTMKQAEIIMKWLDEGGALHGMAFLLKPKSRWSKYDSGDS